MNKRSETFSDISNSIGSLLSNIPTNNQQQLSSIASNPMVQQQLSSIASDPINNQQQLSSIASDPMVQQQLTNIASDPMVQQQLINIVSDPMVQQQLKNYLLDNPNLLPNVLINLQQLSSIASDPMFRQQLKNYLRDNPNLLPSVLINLQQLTRVASDPMVQQQLSSIASDPMVQQQLSSIASDPMVQQQLNNIINNQEVLLSNIKNYLLNNPNLLPSVLIKLQQCSNKFISMLNIPSSNNLTDNKPILLIQQLGTTSQEYQDPTMINNILLSIIDIQNYLTKLLIDLDINIIQDNISIFINFQNCLQSFVDNINSPSGPVPSPGPIPRYVPSPGPRPIPRPVPSPGPGPKQVNNISNDSSVPFLYSPLGILLSIALIFFVINILNKKNV